MPSEGCGERRQAVRGDGAQPHPVEPENLPCPRCDSTNTKFCYYNNYNLSQPRYFCKACRRYWTRGGTLRNVPIGSGSRKNSKRSRPSSTSASSTPPPTSQPIQAVAINMMPSSSQVNIMIKGEIPWPVTCDLNMIEGSFTSLLTANAAALQGGDFLGYGLGQPGFGEMGLGFGYGYGSSGVESNVSENDAGGGIGAQAWQLGEMDGGGRGSVNVMDGGDYFTWPDLAISTPGNGLE